MNSNHLRSIRSAAGSDRTKDTTFCSLGVLIETVRMEPPQKELRWKSTCTVLYFERPSSRDIKNAWFKEKDYKAFKKQCIILSRLANEIGAETLEKYCKDSYRGIECISNKDTKYELRRTRRELAWNVVLEDQAQQFAEAPSRGLDWERICEQYRIISRGALRDAQEIAQDDASSADGFTDADVLSDLASDFKQQPPSKSHKESSSTGDILPPPKVAPVASIGRSSVAMHFPPARRGQDGPWI